MNILSRTRLALGLGILAALMFIGVFASTSHASGPSQTLPYDEAEAQSIDRMIMCPVCPAVSIDQTEVAIARQMRGVIRDKLAEGATRGEILDYFVDRYGVDVLAAPPKSGRNLVVWLLPIAGVVAALGAAFLIIRSMASRSSISESTSLSPIRTHSAYRPVVSRTSS